MMIVAGMLFDAVAALGRLVGATREDAFAVGAATMASALVIGLAAAAWACVRRERKDAATAPKK